MNLHDYFNSPGSLTVAELAKRISINNPAQIRQWQHGYAKRLPSPENCVAIEQATDGVVKRWDLRPEDWYRIWPELIGMEGAPEVPQCPATIAQPAINTVARGV
jgi:DNA-binding transcriptional regulator YdaS (Cro superfamily)